MTDLLFGQSYFLRFDPKLEQAMQPYAPLGTLYAAAFMRERGYSVALFDAMLAQTEEEWDAALAAHTPRFAVLFEDNFNYLSKMCLLRMREAAVRMIGMAKARGCIVIACGADMTDHPGLYLDSGADFVLLGEGEASLAELVDALTGRSGQSPHAMAGVQSRDTLAPVRRPDLRDLDALPFPAWDLVDVARYRRIWLARHGYFSMNMVTTRGCPYHCNWCAKPIWGQRYNTRSPANVAAELRMLRERYQPDHIWFADDIFGLKPGWIARYAQHVAEPGIRTPFKCLLRADLVTEEVAGALADAGCRTVWMGAESGSQRILDAMEKGDTVGDIRAATLRLRSHGIQVGFFLQFGYPGERWSDIGLTRQMVRACLPDDIGISVSYPLPGTKFHARVAAELGGKQNWRDSSDLAMLYRGPYEPGFYRALHRFIHAEYRLHRIVRTRDWRKAHRVPVELVQLGLKYVALQRHVRAPG